LAASFYSRSWVEASGRRAPHSLRYHHIAPINRIKDIRGSLQPFHPSLWAPQFAVFNLIGHASFRARSSQAKNASIHRGFTSAQTFRQSVTHVTAVSPVWITLRVNLISTQRRPHFDQARIRRKINQRTWGTSMDAAYFRGKSRDLPATGQGFQPSNAQRPYPRPYPGQSYYGQSYYAQPGYAPPGYAPPGYATPGNAAPSYAEIPENEFPNEFLKDEFRI
jgi:hypothetical protein